MTEPVEERKIRIPSELIWIVAVGGVAATCFMMLLKGWFAQSIVWDLLKLLAFAASAILIAVSSEERFTRIWVSVLMLVSVLSIADFLIAFVPL